MGLPKRQSIFKRIFAILIIIFALGLIATGAQQTNAIFSGAILDVGASGGSLFSGQKVCMALNPRPEPPHVYGIDLISGRGLFSGQIVSIYLRPQPEPP